LRSGEIRANLKSRNIDLEGPETGPLPGGDTNTSERQMFAQNRMVVASLSLAAILISGCGQPDSSDFNEMPRGYLESEVKPPPVVQPGATVDTMPEGFHGLVKWSFIQVDEANESLVGPGRKGFRHDPDQAGGRGTRPKFLRNCEKGDE
jgi:hypothetical protein